MLQVTVCSRPVLPVSFSLSLQSPSTEVQNYIYIRAFEGSSLRLVVWKNQLNVNSYFQAFVAEMCNVLNVM